MLPLSWVGILSYKRLVATVSISHTSIYPAKGRPGSRTIELDSGAQKRLIRSRIEG